MDAGEVVPVTQADREAAATQTAWVISAEQRLDREPFFHAGLPDAIRRGVWDDHDIVQAFARHRLAQSAADRAAIETARGEVERLTAAAQAAHDTLIELNPNNYDHSDVCEANDAAVEAILLLADALGETHGKTPEWWAQRRAALSAQPGEA